MPRNVLSSSGRFEELQSVRASESASQRGKRQSRKKNRSQRQSQDKTSTAKKTNEKKPTEPGPYLSGSDLEPPNFMMQRSIRIVEAWLDDCDKARDEFEKAATRSMVSLLGGGIVDRPSLDVEAYKSVQSKERGTSSKRRSAKLSSLRSIFKPVSSWSGNSFEPPSVRDCVYDKPSGSLNKDLLEEMNNGKEENVLQKFQKLFRRKKAVKGDWEGSNSDLPRDRHSNQEKDDDPELFMSGGRSPGVSGSLGTLLPVGEENSSRQTFLSGSSIGYCLCGDNSRPGSMFESDVGRSRFGDKSKSSWMSYGLVEDSNCGDKSARISLSESAISQSLSGDDITHQTVFHTSTKHKTTSHCSTSTLSSATTMSSPSSSCSRASSFNIGSIIERSISPRELEEREERERLESEIDRAPSPFPFKPSTPRPIQTQPVRSWASIPLRRKPSMEDFGPVAPEPVGAMYASPPKPIPVVRVKPPVHIQEPGGFVREQMAMPGVAGQGIQAFAVNRERRRADRVSGGTGEFDRAEDQARMDERTDMFTKNRERRRAERNSAGRVMGMKDERGMISGAEKKGGKSESAGQKKRGEGDERRAFNVDEEPVASGAAWETRTKKGQSPAKKSPSEKYRQEERAKYWSPK